MHELYLWPFQDALKAGTANIMLVALSNETSGIFWLTGAVAQVLLQPSEQLSWVPEQQDSEWFA